MSIGPTYTPGAAVGGAVPPDLAKKAANLQLMGILSIVFCFCCGCVTLVLAIMVLTQAGGVESQLAQYGSPPDLVGKVSTGKMCSYIALGILAVGFVIGVIAQLAGLGNQ
jgi:hypothetical protein